MKALRSNTVNSDVQAFKADVTLAQVPMGYTLDGDQEKRLWDNIVACRSASNWSDVELLLVHKIVKLQSVIEDQQKILDREGQVIESRLGEPKVNPRTRAILALNNQLIDLMSRIHILHSPASGSALKNRANKNREAAGLMEKAKASGLLATADDDADT